MGKNDSNKYDNDKRFAEGDRRKETRIKNPVSTGSKRSKERNALRKVVDRFTGKNKQIYDDDNPFNYFDDSDEIEPGVL